MSELRDGSDIIGRPSGLTSKVLKFHDKFVQGISLHLNLQEFLVSSQLFLTVSEHVPEISFK